MSLIYRAEEGVENYKVIFHIFVLLLIRIPNFCVCVYEKLNNCVALRWNCGVGLTDFSSFINLIIFSPSSRLRGSMCVCQGKPLSVTWSFLSEGRWSWVKTARWYKCSFFSLTLIWPNVFEPNTLNDHSLFCGTVVNVSVINNLFSLNQTHKSCIRRSANSKDCKEIYGETPPSCVSRSIIHTGSTGKMNQAAKICWVIWCKTFSWILIWLNSAKQFAVFSISSIRPSC